MSATADLRYTFVPQFLMGATIHARRALEIERDAGAAATESAKVEHRACVVSAIMQSAAALDAEISEITLHGPGSHLGSNGMDVAARDFLRPLADAIDRHDVLRRFELVLHLLRRPGLPSGEQPRQDAQLLIRLRNEVVHYKSRWGLEMEQTRLFRGLEGLHHERPPFVPDDGNNFFPHRCLSGACAQWAGYTALTFLDAFYSRLDIPSRLSAYRDRLVI